MQPIDLLLDAVGGNQTVLADRIGVTQSMVSKIKRGKNRITWEVCLRAEKELGISRRKILPELFENIPDL